MKKATIFLIIFIIGLFLILPFSASEAKNGKKGVILTTGDIKEDYKRAKSGIITCKISSTEIEQLIEKLREEAEKIDADAVIFVRFVGFGGYFFIYGTPVKILEEE